METCRKEVIAWHIVGKKGTVGTIVSRGPMKKERIMQSAPAEKLERNASRHGVRPWPKSNAAVS